MKLRVIIKGYENQITYSCSIIFVVWTTYFIV